MDTLLADETDTAAERRGAAEVPLADGTLRNLDGLTKDELLALQWEQEQAFARLILAAAKGSSARASVTKQAYDTVTRIFAARLGAGQDSLVMGMHPRHQRLVVDLLRRQRRRGMATSFFEIGYATGKLLRHVRAAGFAFAGIEVSAALREAALATLGPECGSQLHLGAFLDFAQSTAAGSWSLVYWNDVFEHVPPDEIDDWLRQIHRLLTPGGQLVTITPNWHVRPSDVTSAVRPPRTEAAGLHLKEYTLREVSQLLGWAGFKKIATPLAIAPRRVVLCGRGLLALKRAAEPGLEWLPLRLTRLVCRGMGLSTTIATKAR